MQLMDHTFIIKFIMYSGLGIMFTWFSFDMMVIFVTFSAERNYKRLPLPMSAEIMSHNDAR